MVNDGGTGSMVGSTLLKCKAYNRTSAEHTMIALPWPLWDLRFSQR